MVADRGNFEGKRLLVLTEGGYGDVFQYARWLPVMASKCSKVTFCVWQRQIDLLKTSPQLKDIEMVPVGSDIDFSQFDCFTSLLSLAALLDATPETVPPSVKFNVEPLVERNGHRMLGVSWQAQEMRSHPKLR